MPRKARKVTPVSDTEIPGTPKPPSRKLFAFILFVLLIYFAVDQVQQGRVDARQRQLAVDLRRSSEQIEKRLDELEHRISSLEPLPEAVRSLGETIQPVDQLNRKVDAFIEERFQIVNPDSYVFIKRDSFRLLSQNDRFLAETYDLISGIERYHPGVDDERQILRDHTRRIDAYFEAVADGSDIVRILTTVKSIEPGENDRATLGLADTTVQPSSENMRLMVLPIEFDKPLTMVISPKRRGQIKVGDEITISARLYPVIDVRIGENFSFGKSMPGMRELQLNVGGYQRTLEDASSSSDDTVSLQWRIYLDDPNTHVVWFDKVVLTPEK